MGTEVIYLGSEIELVETNYSVEKRYSGTHVIIHKSGNEVKIFSELKEDITKTFPIIEKISRSLSQDSFIIEGELVADKFYAWDITYLGQSIANLTLQERITHLKKLQFNDIILEVERKITKLEELNAAIEWASKLEGSSGAVIKNLSESYNHSSWKKYGKLIPLTVTIMKRVPKDRGSNYLVGIESSKGIDLRYTQDKKLVLGHTFTTDKVFQVGDHIEILVEDIWRHEDSQGLHYSIHKPRITGKSELTLSTIKDLELGATNG